MPGWRIGLLWIGVGAAALILGAGRLAGTCGSAHCTYVPIVRGAGGAISPSSTPAPTPTSTPTPTSNPIPSLRNGTFEQGRDGAWQEISLQQLALIQRGGEALPAHAGAWLAQLGGADGESSEISQTVELPSDPRVALAFVYQIRSDDICGYDSAEIIVNQTVLEQLPLCASASTASWQTGFIELNRFAGGPASIRFRASTDASSPSSLYLDDITLVVVP